MKQIPKTYTGAYLWHKLGYTGKGVVIAIVDTGVQPHEDLTLIDGWGDNGWNAQVDAHGHGTHVAGIAAGKKYGVAPDAKILPVRISENGQSNTFTMVAALNWLKEWASKHTERLVVNISFTGTDSPNVLKGIDDLVAMNIPVCVAAGNTGGEVAEIANYESPIVVANLSDESHMHTTSTCRGKQTDCATVGTEVYSCSYKGGYCYMTGTSMASPAVAGMLALILSRYPTITEQAAFEKLMRYGVDTPVKCKDGKHLIPYVSFAHTGCEKAEMRTNGKIANIKKGYKLIVRAAANSAADKVGNVTNDETVVILQADGEWREIAFAPAKKQACTGWINAKYVSEVE